MQINLSPIFCRMKKAGMFTPGLQALITHSAERAIITPAEKRVTASPGFANYLAKGWIFQRRAIAGSKDAILRVFLPGELIDSAGGPWTGLYAASRVIVVAAPRQPGDEDLRRLLEREAAESLRLATSHVARLGRMDAEERMAHALLDIDARLRGADPELAAYSDFPMTQAELGDYLGLSAVHVNRVLKALRSRGVLSVARSRLEILRPADLRQICRWTDEDEPWGETPGGGFSLARAG